MNNNSWPLAPLALVALVGMALTSVGCGTVRLHRPQDAALAEKARAQFEAADLAATVKAERDRLDQMLAAELELVEKHTLARRDARLVFLIDRERTREAWDFLEQDLSARLRRLGISDRDQLRDFLIRDARASRQLEKLATVDADYAVEKSNDSTLPDLDCPQTSQVEPPAEGSVPRIFWDEHHLECQRYLAMLRGQAEGQDLLLGGTLTNGTAIAAMQGARSQARQATQEAVDGLEDARAAIKEARAASSEPADREPLRTAAQKLIAHAGQVERAMEAFVRGDDGAALKELGLDDLAAALAAAQAQMAALGLGSEFALGDLSALPLASRLEAEREELAAGLADILAGDDASRVIQSLRAIGVALDGADQAPWTALTLKEKQLALDLAAARDRELLFDQTLALLEEQEAAYRNELIFLGQAELRRQELERKGCLSQGAGENPAVSRSLLTGEDAVGCRPLFFRLLVDYSAAWTLGRVQSEQIDYRLIALQHQAALDTSEIAFQKWASLLGPPIEQIVVFSSSGLKPDELVETLVSALGLGAIAVGVN
ncbi:MAG: hypothetical protein AAGD01_10740 [Acidobacteriota bacterium]